MKLIQYVARPCPPLAYWLTTFLLCGVPMSAVGQTIPTLNNRGTVLSPMQGNAPMRQVGLSGGSGPSWAALRDGGLASRIQAAIASGRASNPLDNSATSPGAPTMTIGAPTLTRQIRPRANAEFQNFFNARGGEATYYAPYDAVFFPVFTDKVFTNLQFLGDGVAGAGFSVEFLTDAASIELIFATNVGGKYHIIVDDKFINPDGITTNPTNSNSDVVRLDFGTSQVHKIRFEGYGANAWRGVNISPTNSVWPTTSPLKIAVIGDSITAGTGDPTGAGWGRDVGLLMGGANVLPIALGGTGYIADRGGASWPFASHLKDDLLRGNVKPDIIVFAGGINDNGVLTQAAVEQCLQIARETLPNAAIVVMGSFAGNSGPSAPILDVEAKIKAAVAASKDDNTYFMPVSSATEPWIFGTGREGAPTGDGNSDIYSSPDGTHPNRAGHAQTARRFIEGLEQVVLPQMVPADITLSNSSIAENQPVGTTVGTFATSDTNANSSLTYSLVDGAGSANNASFSIVGDVLKTAASFDYETKNSYLIRVKAIDQNGGTSIKTFTIDVTNVNEEVPSLIVTTDSDIEAEDGKNSLREAIAFANRDGVASDITFDATVFDSARTIMLNGTDLMLSPNNKISITGPASGVTISANNASRVFNVNSGTDATLNNLTLSNGSSDNGGAILNSGTLTITGGTLSGNVAGNAGGAITNVGTLTIVGGTLLGNTGKGGGAIYNSGALTITGSTLSGNSSEGSGGGGAIYSFTTATTVTNPNPTSFTLIQNSTLTGNRAGYLGGAVFNNSGLTRIESSTIAGNSAPIGNGAGVLGNSGSSNGSPISITRVRNSIIADNRENSGGGGSTDSGTDVDFTIGPNNTNTFVSEGNNAIGDGNARGKFNQTGDQISVTAVQINLGGLAPNGGPTQTRALLMGSVAIDKGATALNVDQRGVTRDSKPDIGAFEFALSNTPPKLNNATYTAVVGSAFSQQLAGSDADAGDTLTYTLKPGSGLLPNGLALSSGGLITGTPGTAGRFDFSIDVSDGAATTTAKFIIIVSAAGVDGVGPIVTRRALDPSYTRAGLASLIYTGTVRDVAQTATPAITPVGVKQVLFQLRQGATAYSGNEGIGFTSNLNLGYFPAFLGATNDGTAAGTSSFRRNFASFIPSSLPAGAYSLVILGQDNLNNFSVEVVPVTITAPAAGAAKSPFGVSGSANGS